MAVSEAELLSRRAIRSLYEGRPLTSEEKGALKALVAEADHGLKYVWPVEFTPSDEEMIGEPK